MNDAQPARTAARYVAPAPRRRGGDRRAGPPGDRPPLPDRAGVLLAVRPAECRGWSRRQRPDRGARPSTASAAVVVVPIGFVSDHMEVIYDLDTEAAATAEKAGIDVRPGRDRRASTRGSSRWCATCCSSGPPSSAAPSRSRATVGGQAAVVGRLPGRLLRQPARPAAGAVRAATEPGMAYDDLLDARRRRRRRGRRAGPRPAPRRGRGGRHQVQPDRRGHRGRPGRRGADPRPADDRAARRRLPRRGGRQRGVHQRRDLGRRPDRRHRELPLRHPALRGLDRRRPSTAEIGRRGGGQRAERRGVHRHPRRRRPSTAAGCGCPTARRRRWPSGWSAPASTTWPRSRCSRPSPCRALLHEVRDIRRMGSAALDLCAVAAGRVDALRRGGPEPLGHRGRRAGRHRGRRAAGEPPRGRRHRLLPVRPARPASRSSRDLVERVRVPALPTADGRE